MASPAADCPSLSRNCVLKKGFALSLRRLFLVQLLAALALGAIAGWARWRYINSPGYLDRQLIAKAPVMLDSIPTSVDDWVEATAPEQRGWTTPLGIAMQQRVFRRRGSDDEVIVTVAIGHPRNLQRLQHLPSCLFGDVHEAMGIVETDQIEIAPFAAEGRVNLGAFRVEHPAASPDWDPTSFVGQHLSHPSRPISYVWVVGTAEAWDAPDSERLFYDRAPKAVKLIVGATDPVGMDPKAAAAVSQRQAADFVEAIMPAIRQAVFAD